MKSRFSFLPVLFLSFLFVFLHCKIKTTEVPEKLDRQMDPVLLEPHTCPYSLEMGKLYGKQGRPEEAKFIFSVIEILLIDICSGNLNHLPEFVNSDMGLFVDAKGHWTREEVLKDLKDTNGYFATNFWKGDLLDEKKKSKGNLTIQKAFASAKLIYTDFHFDSNIEVEVQFRFQENPKNARYLINPVFRKMNDKWMLLRMF